MRLLLERGADPNTDLEWLVNDCPLWDLQYNTGDPAADAQRLEIVRLFLRYGADPDLVSCGESLFDAVQYKVYNEISEDDWDYVVRFYKLLILYGGGGLHFAEPLDPDREEQYRIALEPCEDGYHIAGFLIGPDGRNIGEL